MLGYGVVAKMVDYRSRRAQLGRIALCAMFTLSLAACGGSETKSDAQASDSSDSPPALTPTASTNNIPILDGEPPLVAKAGVAYRFIPSASDADNDALTFSITGMPTWASFDAASGALT